MIHKSLLAVSFALLLQSFGCANSPAVSRASNEFSTARIDLHVDDHIYSIYLIGWVDQPGKPDGEYGKARPAALSSTIWHLEYERANKDCSIGPSYLLVDSWVGARVGQRLNIEFHDSISDHGLLCSIGTETLEGTWSSISIHGLECEGKAIFYPEVPQDDLFPSQPYIEERHRQEQKLLNEMKNKNE